MTNHLASEPTDGGGRVVITRFDCRNRRTILLFLLVHSRIKRDVRQECPGFIAASRVIIWSDRTLLSITLWRDLDSIYDMGGVPRHIFASRLPGRFNADTTCGIFSYDGDWKALMFGANGIHLSPLSAGFTPKTS